MHKDQEVFGFFLYIFITGNNVGVRTLTDIYDCQYRKFEKKKRKFWGFI